MDPRLKGFFDDQDDDDTQLNKAQDFVSRYELGAPADGIEDDEVNNNFQAVAGRISPEEFEDSAAEAYERLSPEERRQFAEYLKSQGGDDFDASDDPRELARQTSRMQTQKPDGLAGLLGGGGLGDLLGGGGGGLGSLLDGALGGQKQGQGQNQGLGGLLDGILGGQDQNQHQNQGRNQNEGQGNMLQSPLVKAVLGGIAAMAMKRLMGPR